MQHALPISLGYKDQDKIHERGAQDITVQLAKQLLRK
jgi:hypothetical protein